MNLQGLPQAHAVSQDTAGALGGVGRLHRLAAVVPDKLDSCSTQHAHEHTEKLDRRTVSLEPHSSHFTGSG